ncbi:hypothetical protein [Streptomyces sp. cg36]|uniref:hypothetical protein n=1 Tax=Streptomyces sp. cg36 TaxID=3238798 RepID=UPI0034E2278D
MSGDLPEGYSKARLKVTSDDVPPYAMVPMWVVFGFSGPAVKLYALYMGHVNQDRPDNIAWPTLDTLAKMMGYSRGDKISRFQKELIAGGAITAWLEPSKNKLRHRYFVDVKYRLPKGWTGPVSVSDWRDRQKADAPSGNGKTAGQSQAPRTGMPGFDGSPRTGALQSPRTGGFQPPQTGGLTKTTSTKTTSAPPSSARSAVGARSASRAGSRGLGSVGGSAAPSRPRRPRITQRQAEDLRTVEQALRALGWPLEPQRARLPQNLPQPVTDTVLEELEHRTAAELAERVNRRWALHGWAAKAAAGEILSAAAVAVALVRAPECTDGRCEDGSSIDTGSPCPRCAEHEQDRQTAARKGLVPVQRTSVRAVVPVECAGCRSPFPAGRAVPDAGVCRDCRPQSA